MRSKKDAFISAYMYCYGATRAKAVEVYRKATSEYIDAVIESFQKDARDAFYND